MGKLELESVVEDIGRYKLDESSKIEFQKALRNLKNIADQMVKFRVFEAYFIARVRMIGLLTYTGRLSRKEYCLMF